MAKREDDDELTRDEVEALLTAGCRWALTYCAGGRLKPTSGAGPTLPADVLAWIPSEAELRRWQRGKTTKTFVHATVRREHDATLVELEER